MEQKNCDDVTKYFNDAINQFIQAENDMATLKNQIDELQKLYVVNYERIKVLSVQLKENVVLNEIIQNNIDILIENLNNVFEKHKILKVRILEFASVYAVYFSQHVKLALGTMYSKEYRDYLMDNIKNMSREDLLGKNNTLHIQAIIDHGCVSNYDLKILHENDLIDGSYVYGKKFCITGRGIEYCEKKDINSNYLLCGSEEYEKVLSSQKKSSDPIKKKNKN